MVGSRARIELSPTRPSRDGGPSSLSLYAAPRWSSRCLAVLRSGTELVASSSLVPSDGRFMVPDGPSRREARGLDSRVTPPRAVDLRCFAHVRSQVCPPAAAVRHLSV